MFKCIGWNTRLKVAKNGGEKSVFSGFCGFQSRTTKSIRFSKPEETGAKNIRFSQRFSKPCRRNRDLKISGFKPDRKNRGKIYPFFRMVPITKEDLERRLGSLLGNEEDVEWREHLRQGMLICLNDYPYRLKEMSQSR